MSGQEARDELAARVKRMRAWQEMETEDFLASDLEAVLTAAEEVERARAPWTDEQARAASRKWRELCMLDDGEISDAELWLAVLEAARRTGVTA